MLNDWKHLQIAICFVGTLVLAGGFILFQQLNSSTSTSIGLQSSLKLDKTREPASLALTHPEDGIAEIELSCDLQPTQLPPSARFVRFHVPDCKTMEIIAIRNESNAIDASLLHPKEGGLVSELLGLTHGENQIKIQVRATGAKSRKPASDNQISMSFYRAPKPEPSTW